jgi:transcriptional regulator with XRE-family HTH domain
MEPWRLVALRKACGVTQYWLAAKLGLAPCTVSALENGRRRISAEQARRVVAALRDRLPRDAERLLVSDDLLTGVESRRSAP